MGRGGCGEEGRQDEWRCGHRVGERRREGGMRGRVEEGRQERRHVGVERRTRRGQSGGAKEEG